MGSDSDSTCTVFSFITFEFLLININITQCHTAIVIFNTQLPEEMGWGTAWYRSKYKLQIINLWSNDIMEGYMCETQGSMKWYGVSIKYLISQKESNFEIDTNSTPSNTWLGSSCNVTMTRNIIDDSFILSIYIFVFVSWSSGNSFILASSDIFPMHTINTLTKFIPTLQRPITFTIFSSQILKTWTFQSSSILTLKIKA